VVAEQRFREKVEKRNARLMHKLHKASNLLGTQQIQLRRFDREAHLAAQRELALQKQFVEEKALNTSSDTLRNFKDEKTTKTLSKLKGSRSDPRIASQAVNLPKFHIYHQEPPRH
jgi:hypothetical protein